MRIHRPLGAKNMAKVVAAIKVFPADTNLNLQELRRIIESKLPPDTSIYRYDEEPIAFGLVALIAHIIMPEEAGGKMEEVENALNAIAEVSQIQVGDIRRMS